MRGSAVIDSHFSSAAHRFNISIFDKKRSMRRNLLRELRVPNPEMDWSNTAIGKRVDALRERHELLESVMDDIAEMCQKENDALQSNVSSHEVSSNEKMPVDPEGAHRHQNRPSGGFRVGSVRPRFGYVRVPYDQPTPLRRVFAVPAPLACAISPPGRLVWLQWP